MLGTEDMQVEESRQKQLAMAWQLGGQSGSWDPRGKR